MQGSGSGLPLVVLAVVLAFGAPAGCSDEGAGKDSPAGDGTAVRDTEAGDDAGSPDAAPGPGVADCCAPSGTPDCSAAMACCAARGEACGAEGNPCCDGLRCTMFGEGPSSCREVCRSDAECGDGCCLPITGSGSSVCAEPELCGGGSSTCAELDEPCEGVGCCGDRVCVARVGSDAYVCQPTCADDGDCETGCCANIRDADYSACMPPALCR